MPTRTTSVEASDRPVRVGHAPLADSDVVVRVAVAQQRGLDARVRHRVAAELDSLENDTPAIDVAALDQTPALLVALAIGPRHRLALVPITVVEDLTWLGVLWGSVGRPARGQGERGQH